LSPTSNVRFALKRDLPGEGRVRNLDSKNVHRTSSGANFRRLVKIA
jgi:hypothetical protein